MYNINIHIFIYRYDEYFFEYINIYYDILYFHIV